jgi:hypothetical protein
MTDESQIYQLRMTFLRKKHETANHSKKEYVRGAVTTNTVESVSSLLKPNCWLVGSNLYKTSSSLLAADKATNVKKKPARNKKPAEIGGFH